MPLLTAADLEKEQYLRVLLMGPPKCGKTTAAIVTAPGPVGVILCEDDTALKGASRHSPKDHFGFVRAKDWDSMQKAVVEIGQAVKEDGVKTVVVDPFNEWASVIEQQALKSTWNEKSEPDGRRAYPKYHERLHHVVSQLFRLKVHVVVIMHHMDLGGEPIGNQVEKTGHGIAPLLAGQSRVKIPARFHDVVWMEVRRTVSAPKGERVFVTGPEGVWGPGCRSVESTVIPASIDGFLKLIEKTDKEAAKGPAIVQRNGAPAAKPTAPTRPATVRR